MSRSRRRTSKGGITVAPSDKAYKRLSHRRARRALSACDLARDEPPAPKLFGNPWGAPKDGKRWFDAGRFPEEMRK